MTEKRFVKYDGNTIVDLKYFEDAMSPNAFSEMWDNVKEDEKWERRIWND